MSVGAADLTKAVVSAWNSSTLNVTFKSLRDSSVVDSEFSVLLDGEAPAGQPFPYCIFEQAAGDTISRMSRDETRIWETRDIPWVFRVYSREISGVSKSAKQIASELIEAIIEVFGGHPTEPHASLSLDNGNHLITQYQNDFGVRIDEDVYSWMLNYIFRTDIPVTA